MKEQNKQEKRDERDDKVVNFLGIKQSWWRVTSKIYAALLAGYGVWYVFFDLEHEGSFSEWVQIVGQHMLIAGGFLMTAIYAGTHLGDAIMMLHDWYRERRDRRRRETEARLREMEEAQRVAEEATRAAEEATQAAEEATRMAEETLRETEEARRAAIEESRAAEEARRAAIEESRSAAETAAQFRQALAAWNAWNHRRLQAAEKGEDFNEPSPNGSASQDDE